MQRGGRGRGEAIQEREVRVFDMDCLKGGKGLTAGPKIESSGRSRSNSGKRFAEAGLVGKRGRIDVRVVMVLFRREARRGGDIGLAGWLGGCA